MSTKHIADRSEVRQAVRKVLQHHKLTAHGDGVVEADLAHAVVDAVCQQTEPSAWMHEDGRVVTAATMATKDGGAILSSLSGYTIPLRAIPSCS